MNSPTTKIAVFGAGSIGCYLGGLLKSQDADLVFIGRNRLKHAVKQNGLTLTHFQNAPIHLGAEKVTIKTSSSALSDCDLILLCTKSQDTALAAQDILQHAKPGAHVISCQNGIRNVAVLKEELGTAFKVSGAIVPFNVTPTGSASYHCGTGGTLHLERRLPEDVSQAFNKAGQAIQYGGNFEGDQWAKLLVNLNNALNTLSGSTLRESFSQKDYRRAFACVIQEGLDVAKAKDIEIGRFNGRSPKAVIKLLKLPNVLYRILMDHIVKIDAKARSSMLDDLEIGRKSEIEYLQGEIVRQGKILGIETSANSNVLDAINSAFEKGMSPKLSGTEILKLVKK